MSSDCFTRCLQHLDARCRVSWPQRKSEIVTHKMFMNVFLINWSSSTLISSLRYEIFEGIKRKRTRVCCRRRQLIWSAQVCARYNFSSSEELLLLTFWAAVEIMEIFMQRTTVELKNVFITTHISFTLSRLPMATCYWTFSILLRCRRRFNNRKSAEWAEQTNLMEVDCYMLFGVRMSGARRGENR